MAVLELCIAWSRYGDPWTHVLLATVGAALALTGPGAWSVDGRLFGGNATRLLIESVNSAL
jgi:putative oxidoreductase